jgi:hypothetical protein
VIALLALLAAAVVDAGDGRRTTARRNELVNRLGLRVVEPTGPRARVAWALRQWPGVDAADLAVLLRDLGVDPSSDVPTETDPLVPWAIRNLAADGGRIQSDWSLGIGHVRDWWFVEGREQGVDLGRLTGEEAWRLQADWHRRLGEEAEASLLAEEGETRVIHTWPDGWSMVQLLDRAGLEYESHHMGHCIGSSPHYESQIAHGSGVAVSLRDGCGIPHATLWFMLGSFGNSWNLCEARSKGNSFLPERHASRVRAWMEAGPEIAQLYGYVYPVRPRPLSGEQTLDWVMLQPIEALEAAWKRANVPDAVTGDIFDSTLLKKVIGTRIAGAVLERLRDRGGWGYAAGESGGYGQRPMVGTRLVALGKPLDPDGVAYALERYRDRMPYVPGEGPPHYRYAWTAEESSAFPIRDVEIDIVPKWVNTRSLTVALTSADCNQRKTLLVHDFGGEFMEDLVEVDTSATSTGGSGTTLQVTGFQDAVDQLAARLEKFTDAVRTRDPRLLVLERQIREGALPHTIATDEIVHKPALQALFFHPLREGQGP